MSSSVGLQLPDFNISSDQKALVIGAGLAGCAIANELAQRGYECALYDQLASIAASTSALPVAAVHPASSGDKSHTAFFGRSFDLCSEQLDSALFIRCGALQLINPASSSQFNPPHAVKVDAAAATRVAGTRINCDAWHFEKAGYLNPHELCSHLVSHEQIDFKGNTKITELRRTAYGWQLLSERNEVIDESPLVILANAHSAAQYAVSKHIPLQLSRGQIDLFATEPQALQTIIHGDGYLVPTQLGTWSGATHHRDEINRLTNCTDTETNRDKAKALTPALKFTTGALQSFTGVRAGTPDRMPVIGALPDETWFCNNYTDLRHGKPASSFSEPKYLKGLYTITGYGARGATGALFGAQLLADLISGGHCDEDLMKAMHPARFLLRSIRKGL